MLKRMIIEYFALAVFSTSCTTVRHITESSKKLALTDTIAFETVQSSPVKSPTTTRIKSIASEMLATPSLAVEPGADLDNRALSLEELNAFLAGYFPDFEGFDPGTIFESKDVSGDAIHDLVVRDYSRDPEGEIALGLIYQDVSGDDEADLIVFGWHGLFAAIWEKDHYGVPFRIESDWSRGDVPVVSVILQDWTDEGIPEITYDETTLYGGTGLWIRDTTRSIIHCSEKICTTVWDGVYSSKTEDYNTGGLAQFQMDIKTASDSEGNPELQITEDGFSVYCCSDAGLEVDNLQVFTTTRSVYSWDNDQFKLKDQEVINPIQVTDSLSQLENTNSKGDTAVIEWEDNQIFGNANEYCQLLINGKTIGSYFGCRNKFTSVNWKDITNDQQEDLVILTYSAGYPYGPEDLLSDETCMHQWIIVYQWDGGKATEIANVSGCVQRDDLFGVRIEDYDQDGQIEILAASGDETKVRIYEWDGAQFVYTGDV